MSSSQLTFTPSFFRGVGSPHQPEYYLVNYPLVNYHNYGKSQVLMMNNFIIIMMFISFAHFHCPPIFHESECQDAATRAGTAASEPSGSARQQRRGAAERRGAETKRGGAR